MWPMGCGASTLLYTNGQPEIYQTQGKFSPSSRLGQRMEIQGPAGMGRPLALSPTPTPSHASGDVRKLWASSPNSAGDSTRPGALLALP